jgi:acetyl esterase/lipase
MLFDAERSSVARRPRDPDPNEPVGVVGVSYGRTASDGASPRVGVGGEHAVQGKERRREHRELAQDTLAIVDAIYRRPMQWEIRYGREPSQLGDLYAPPGAGPFPVIVTIHGGFWKLPYDRQLARPLALDLVARGYAVWNIEYRRLGEPGGGWPGTFEDVARAVDTLAEVATSPSAAPTKSALAPVGVGVPLDLRNVVALGHSAGGHLALWLAARSVLPPGELGSRPLVPLAGAVSQAGVLDLRSAHAERIGSRSVEEFLGGTPATVPQRYRIASPPESLPLGIPQLVVHGDSDAIVPLSIAENYARAAVDAGDRVELFVPESTGHFDLIDPEHPAWDATVSRLPFLQGEARGTAVRRTIR